MSPPIQYPWRFCHQYNCGAPDRDDSLQNRLWARLWLQQLKGDPLKMRILRDLVAHQVKLPPSRMADEAVVEQVAELLISGRLHIHAKKIEARPAGGVTTSEGESVVAFPISEHQSRDPEPAPQFADPPSFPAKADLVAQAAALSAAAAAGSPFCPV